ncbi:MAG: MBL fold metallo-hydrolase [Chthonomonadales bacterium]
MTSDMIRDGLSRRDVLKGIAGLSGVAALGSAAMPTLASTRRVRDFYGDEIDLQGDVKVEKLADNIYVLSGVGGNIAILTGKDDTLQIDSGNPGTTAAVQKGTKTVTDKAVNTLINTHWHGDHTGGNEDLGKIGGRIFAHDNVRTRLGSDQFIEAFNSKVPAHPAIALPIVTFDDKMTVHHNGEVLHLTHVPPAHTDGDITILFEKANILHAGDLFFNGMYPFIDSSTGGWIGGMAKAADQILAMTDDSTKIIPGHGPVGNKQQFKVYRDMLVKVESIMTPLVKSGKTAAEIVAAKPLAELDGKWGMGFMKPETFIPVVYGGIKKFGM